MNIYGISGVSLNKYSDGIALDRYRHAFDNWSKEELFLEKLDKGLTMDQALGRVRRRNSNDDSRRLAGGLKEARLEDNIGALHSTAP